jgi:hypothetical protein
MLAQGAPDPNNPRFVDLLFNADSATLRVFMKGTVTVPDIPLQSLDFFHQTWTTAEHVAVLFGKTFDTPPIATSVHKQSASVIVNSFMEQDETQLSSGVSISTIGCGVASALDRIHVWNAYLSLIGTSKQISYLVFDRSIGG